MRVRDCRERGITRVRRQTLPAIHRSFKFIIIWQGSLGVNPSILIGSFLVRILLYGPFHGNGHKMCIFFPQSEEDIFQSTSRFFFHFVSIWQPKHYVVIKKSQFSWGGVAGVLFLTLHNPILVNYKETKSGTEIAGRETFSFQKYRNKETEQRTLS